ARGMATLPFRSQIQVQAYPSINKIGFSINSTRSIALLPRPRVARALASLSPSRSSRCTVGASGWSRRWAKARRFRWSSPFVPNSGSLLHNGAHSPRNAARYGGLFSTRNPSKTQVFLRAKQMGHSFYIDMHVNYSDLIFVKKILPSRFWAL